MNDRHHGLVTLSFADSSRSAGKITLWKSAPTTDVAECNRLGRDRADELLTLMATHDLPFLLGHVVAAMVERGLWGPMETGFFQRVAEYALAGEIEFSAVPQPAQRPTLSLVKS